MKTIKENFDYFFNDFKSQFKGPYTNYLINNHMDDYKRIKLNESEKDIVKVWDIVLPNIPGEYLKIIILEDVEITTEAFELSTSMWINLNDEISRNKNEFFTKYFSDVFSSSKGIALQLCWKENGERKFQTVSISKEESLKSWLFIKAHYNIVIYFDTVPQSKSKTFSHSAEGSNENHSKLKIESSIHEFIQSTACSTLDNELLQEMEKVYKKTCSLKNEINELKTENFKLKYTVEENSKIINIMKDDYENKLTSLKQEQESKLTSLKQEQEIQLIYQRQEQESKLNLKMVQFEREINFNKVEEIQKLTEEVNAEVLQLQNELSRIKLVLKKDEKEILTNIKISEGKLNYRINCLEKILKAKEETIKQLENELKNKEKPAIKEIKRKPGEKDVKNKKSPCTLFPLINLSMTNLSNKNK